MMKTQYLIIVVIIMTSSLVISSPISENKRNLNYQNGLKKELSPNNNNWNNCNSLYNLRSEYCQSDNRLPFFTPLKSDSSISDTNSVFHQM